VSFADNLNAAEFVLSTSVAEGFGMVFLEPWLADRRVIARRIPGVADDFEAAGIDLSEGYDRLSIPGDARWISQTRREYRDALREAQAGLPEAFLKQLDSPSSDPAGEDTDRIDFAELTPSRQIEVLHRSASDPGFDLACRQSNGELIKTLTEPPTRTIHDRIARNKDLIRKFYSLDAQAAKLQVAYQAVLSSVNDEPVLPPAHAGVGFETIVGRHVFYPCRTETFESI